MRRMLAGVVAAIGLLPAGAVHAQEPPEPPSMPGSFELVGHDPLMNRGMNAALAVLDGYAYVGSRTDGSHANAGLMVVDVRNPAAPAVVQELGPPNEGLPTQTSRELRILPDQKLLLVLHHQCSELLHRCASPSNTGITVFPSNILFYDIAGANAADPKLVATYLPSASAPQTPHEFFLWSDPKRPGRVLMYMSTPSGGDSQIVVTDISRAREGVFAEIAKFSIEASSSTHSMTVSNDGTRMFIAQLTAGFMMADTSDLAADRPKPEIRLLTQPERAPTWPGPGAHSAVPLPGRGGHVMITDEVYGQVPGLLSNHGCPWGWVRFINVADPAAPVVESEYKLPANEQSYCDTVGLDRNTLSSHAAHNPTLTEHLALLGWHSEGLQAIDTTDPLRPAGAASFMPTPLQVVQTEDPLLSSGPDKVVAWSFPTIVRGLVYFTDVRNGLYIVRYRGPYAHEVSRAAFLDGASNSGDVQRLDPVGPAAAGSTATPAARAPRPCLATPLRAAGGRFGPFTVGQTIAQARLRGGPPASSRGGVLTYCARGGGRVVAAARGGRIVLLATSSRKVTGLGVLTPGRPAVVPRGAQRIGIGLVVVRGTSRSRFAVLRRGRIAAVGIATGRPSAAALRGLVRAARL